jgi:replicative DNA helicase
VDAGEHGKTVLAVILGAGGVKALDYAARHVSDGHFEDRVQKALFVLAQRYADQTRGTLPRHALEDLLRERPPGTALLYLEYYDLLTGLHPSASDFKHSVAMLRELHSEKETAEALAQGMEILRAGAKDERGNDLRGAGDARAHVQAAFADIERENSAGQAPEGDTRTEMARVRETYARARELRLSGRSAGVSTGIAPLDEVLSGGLSPGELALLVGFTSAGKSQFMAHLAWHTSAVLGRNVVLFASETTRANMLVRILGRHSKLPKFGLPGGLNTRDIRAGTLSAEEYAAFREVTEDFARSPGQPYIVQVPRGFTVSWLEARLNAVSRQFMPDLCLIDYLGLARPERTRKDRREELGLILQDAKQLAVTFGDGHGVPIASPWQISREGRRAVRERGGYVLSDLSETAEAANTPDVILSVLEPENDDTRGRAVPLKFDVLKNRENERYVRLELQADFACSYFQLRDSAGLSNPLLAEEDE